jgi:Na+/H+ antiporter NhaA
MAVAVTIYLLFNAGSSSARGWGIAMSTDTAFALGLLALVGPPFPNRLRAFMLTAVVFDDLVALVVIATVYTETLRVVPLVVAVGCYAAVLVAGRRVRFGPRVACSLLGVGAWVALLEAGVEPVVIGLAMGLLAYAYPVPRSRLERATERFREFREQPTAELARVARVELRSATSVNERLQQLFHPWTSYVIVPLFALANAGIAIDGGVLARAFSSPITLGILVGYVVGKPVGILGGSWLLTRLSGGRGRRHDRRDRLHGRAAGRHPRLRRRPAPGGEARHPRRRAWSRAPQLVAVPGDGTAAAAHAHPRPARSERAARRPVRRGRPGARPCARPG